MKQLVLILVGLTLLSQLSQARHSNLHEWREYKLKYGKVYESAEEDARRFGLFLAAKGRIRQHNAQNGSFKMGLNHLADSAPEELVGGFNYRPEFSEAKQREAMGSLERIVNKTYPIPKEIDWRKEGRVSSVKDEGRCNSNWAFAVVGAMEGQEKTRANISEAKSLSVQALLDCSGPKTGCKEGDIVDAMKAIPKIGGLELEEDYPYTGKVGECRFDKAKSVIKNDGYYEFYGIGEDMLASLVANYGPVAVGVSKRGWQYYKSGIFDGRQCNGDFDHAVLVVGYGTDPKLGDYWILKNSWSEKWGEAGYMRIRRRYFDCHIGAYSVIPQFNN
uniref:Cathepsin L n=1 Tax=Aceria tosichella TaxID=561515 RepID=A0A6G1S5N3_9ACAR